MDEITRDYIKTLKEAQPFTGVSERVGDDEYKFQVLGRGEMAFYQHNERALLLEILAGKGVIFARSIRQWDNGKKVTPQEREQIIEIISKAMRRSGNPDVSVYRK